MINDPLLGYQLGNFRIERLIGRGGMAQVYYGWDQSLHRPVAIKVIDARLRDDPVYAQRFVQEARAVATWRHENILQIYYADQEEGLYYFVMEYIDGLDLGQLMAQYANDGELMPHDDVLRIGGAVAKALDYAHSQKVIHRDVKPSNIMIARDGRVVLADFGLAMNVQRGSMGGTFGTPHYTAPEQARNSASAVPQSDLYSLGVILYEMLTGVVPFDDPSPTSLALQHLTKSPPLPRTLNPELNHATEVVLLKVLSKTPVERYPNGHTLIEALGEALAEGPEDSASLLSLPPLPVGVTAPPVRSLSQVSVVQRVSLHTPPPPPEPAPFIPAEHTPVSSAAASPIPLSVPSTVTPVTPSLSAASAWNQPVVWLAIGGGAVSLLIAALLLSLLVRGNRQGEIVVAVASNTATFSGGLVETEGATSTVLSPTTDLPTVPVASPTPFPPEVTPLVVQVITPTLAPEPATAATNEPLPTATPEPFVPTAPPATPAATILYPGGRRLVLLYDSYSFYLYNPGTDRIRSSSLAFESLDGNGQPAGYSFNGTLWAQFYSFIDPGRCGRLEINRAPSLLRPAQCQAYSATVTPSTDADTVFWIPRPGVSQFRVLWNGEEVGRCETTTTSCEVFVP